jgi:hypothetical protein
MYQSSLAETLGSPCPSREGVVLFVPAPLLKKRTHSALDQPEEWDWEGRTTGTVLLLFIAGRTQTRRLTEL